jgi:hypothetical protein
VIKRRNYWTDLWYAMAKGDIAQIEALKAIETVEFFQLLKNWEKSLPKK